MNRKSERGNILFIILIAVVLFGALSYAVSNSMRGSGKEASGEKIDVAIAAMQQYALSLESAINRMLLVSELKPEDLLFDPEDSSVGLSDSEKRRLVFGPLGGGQMRLESFSTIRAIRNNGIRQNPFNEVKGIGTSSATSTPTSTTRDLIFFVFNLSESMCSRINQKLGLSATIPTLNDISIEESAPIALAANPFTASQGGVITAPTLDGQPQGCFFDGNGGFDHIYYYVLVAR